MNSLVEQISNLEMQTDAKYSDHSLVEALELYHQWIDNKVFIPRGNQLNKSGQPMKPVLVNTPRYSFNIKETN